MLFADYHSYVECQEQITQNYKDRDKWTRMSILNTVRMGKFSSDRAVREYCKQIWAATPVKVELDAIGKAPHSISVAPFSPSGRSETAIAEESGITKQGPFA
jgi:starch phosphorylase